ncbi:hypothetical protein GCM10022239_03900 [Leifsonia bigeumensis]|uniref:HTH cro/C1-type domain-containing protein n=1 Tax=Leifsonella bigeumensis TaxID=433643 RepID=A0ABP7F5A8_9MICO
MNTPTPSLSKAISAEIRAELARKQLDAKALLPVLELSKNTIYSRVKGDTDFTTAEISKVAHFFGLTEYDLIDAAQKTSSRGAAA